MILVPIFAILAVGGAEPAWIASPPPALPDRMHVTLNHYRVFTECAAGTDWHISRALFGTQIGSAEERQVMTRITGGSDGTTCSYAYRMRMSSILLRGGIAEARYRRLTAEAPAQPIAEDIAAVPSGATFEWVGFNRESPAAALHAFANCLAARETGVVHAVLLTRIGSSAERAAMQAMSRRIGTCLDPGQRLRANSLTLRPWLAEAQYQRLRASRADTDQ